MSLDQKITDEDVEMAFNMLLGRSAGQVGIDHFHEIGVKAGWTKHHLRASLIGSSEYKIISGVGQIREGSRMVEMAGFKLCIDPNEPDFGCHIAHGAQYEAHNLAILRRELHEGDTFVDIGANVGVLSLAARLAVGDTGKVICFEPMAANAALLVESIIINDFSNMVLYPVALSDEVRTLYLEGNSNGMLLDQGRPERKMTTRPGDPYLEREPRIDFVKMDIEGHEPMALRGIAGALKKHRPMIMCEYNPTMLRNTSHSDPTAFADQIFAMTAEIQVIDYDGNVEVVRNTASLLDLWEVKNRYFSDNGRIMNGMLHFDLLFRADPKTD
jgi:FkbM family methyltransferase